MKLLLLGAGGFIGSHLAEQLLANTEHQITGLDLEDEKIDEFKGIDRFQFMRGDLRGEEKTVRKWIHDADCVVDLIAHANPSLYVERPLDVFHLNFTENLKIAEWCLQENRRLIQFSSCEVYGKTVASVAGEYLKNPEDPMHAHIVEDQTDFILGPVVKHRWIYACAKQLLERVLHAMGLEHGLNWCVIRPFNYIGPKIDYLPHEEDGNPRVFSHFMTGLLTGDPMKLVDGGHHRRCYSYIGDAIDCMVRIIERPEKTRQQVFNVGNPDNEISIRDMAYLMRDIFEEKFAGPDYQRPEIVEVSSQEFYGEGYEDSDRRIPDITKARTLVGWEPKIGIRETCELSMAYYVERHRQHQGDAKVVR